MLKGRLTIPNGATNLVVFAHRSGISCHNSSFCYLAKSINNQGCATLLINLLAPGQSLLDDEPQTVDLDLSQLAERLTWVADWAMYEPSTRDLKLTFFADGGALDSTLAAALMRRTRIDSVVSLGGRLDLARIVLSDIDVPLLMLVGDQDRETYESNQSVINLQPNSVEQRPIPDASQLLDEPVSLSHVAKLSTQWLLQTHQRLNAKPETQVSH